MRTVANDPIRIARAVYWGALVLALSAFFVAASPPGKNRKPIQALTYRNVLSLFERAQFRATAVQKRCTVFFEGEWKSREVYDYCLIIVENSDEDIQITFYLTDAHEMNWISEFLDSPLFAAEETQSLFELMNSGHDVRRKKVGRFKVDFHHWEPRHAQILVFSFSPR